MLVAILEALLGAKAYEGPLVSFTLRFSSPLFLPFLSRSSVHSPTFCRAFRAHYPRLSRGSTIYFSFRLHPIVMKVMQLGFPIPFVYAACSSPGLYTTGQRLPKSACLWQIFPIFISRHTQLDSGVTEPTYFMRFPIFVRTCADGLV
jgi:hypothetical protein